MPTSGIAPSFHSGKSKLVETDIRGVWCIPVILILRLMISDRAVGLDIADHFLEACSKFIEIFFIKEDFVLVVCKSSVFSILRLLSVMVK